MTPHDIIPDSEIDNVHGGNFGSMTNRGVVDDGVLKYAFGYESGNTQMSILIEHGLIAKPKPGSYKSRLTKKGQSYFQAMFRGVKLADILSLTVRRRDPPPVFGGE